jgi:endoribonuclease Nob1
VYVLDTCAFLSQKHPNGKLITISQIESEIQNKQSLQYFLNLKEIGLEIREPSRKNLEIVKSNAVKTGDLDVLSDTDQKILAIAYETKSTIVSDDFAIQNVALYMNIEYISCNGKTIKELRKWKYKCSACNFVSANKNSECITCGSKDIFRIKAK